MAVAGARTVQQVLAEADESKAQDLLFTLLAEQAKGKELSSVVAEIAQGVLRGKWSIHVKRLAYDLCKNVPLSDADSQFVIAGIRMDINSADVELCALALRMLAQMPHHLLATLLSTGELAQLCSRPLGSDNVSVRAAAVDMLGAVLLVPEVLHAASGSAGMANQVNEHWQALTDALLDDDQNVVAAAVSATTALLRAGLWADVRSAEGFLVERLAAISAARVVSALGAVVHAFSEVTAQGRVDALALLQLLVEHATQAGQWAAADVGGAAGLPTGTILPGLTSLAPSVWGYCAGLLRSGDPAVRLEAARTVLHVAVLVSQPRTQRQAAATRLTGGGNDMDIGSTPGSIPLPTGLLLEAVSALLELEDSVPLVEAAAQDVLGVVVDGLPALAKQERARVLLQLWAGIGRVKNTPARMELWARAWAAVVQDDDPMVAGSPESASSLLSVLLTESYVSNVLSGRVVPPPLVASSSFRSLNASSSASAPALGPAPRSLPAAFAASAASTNDIMSRPANMAGPPSPRPVAAPVKVPEPVKPVKKEKEKKEKEKTRFFGMLKGSGKDKDREPPPEAPSLTERAAPVAASVPSKTQEARSAVSAAGAAVVSASAGARAATSAAGAAVASAAAAAATMVSDLLTSDNAHARGPPVACYGSQRHELAASLLAVVHTCHPAAGLAWQLCADVSHATAHDQAASTVLSAKYNAWQQQRILTWVTAARTVLQATAVCMQWEPSVVPAITPNTNPTIAARASADFATTVQDLWLQLLQASSVAVRALQTLSKPPPGAAGAPTLGNLPPGGELTSLRSEAQQSDAQRSESSTVNTPHGTPRHQPPLASMASVTSTTSQMTRLANPALHAANMEAKELTTIMKQVLRDWGGLSRAVRARALWVFSHSMDMGPHADEQWEHGLKALQDVLCKLVASGNVARVSDLLGSAAQGVLYRSGRVGWSRDRAFAFDVVAASALCERPDYDTIGLVVGLTAAQAWATRLQDALAACPADASKRVMADVVFQAGRLEAVLREFMANADTAASPILREWGKRTMRALAATAVFQHPAARALEEAEAAAKKAKEKAEAAERGEDENGYDPHATIHSSSSSSSDAGQDMGNLLPVSLPTTMYLPGGGARARPALAPQQNAGVAFTPVSRLVEQPSLGFTTGQIAQPGSPSAQAAGREQEPFKARAIVLHGALPAHMAASNSSNHPWGYPFAPAPRASALFYSKRSRRSRTLTAQTWQAVKQCGGGQHDKNTGLADVPVLPINSALRLDSPTFWSLLPAGGGTVYDTASGGHWAGSSQAAREGGATRMELIELCGPGDPVMLVGSLRRDSSDASQLLLRITAINRSDADVRGAVVQVVALGPAQLDRRAASWAVPRLSPRDRCTHAFHLRLLGYGLVRLSLRLQLVYSGTGAVAVAPVTLPCRPLHVGLVQHMLRAPVGGTPSAQAFCNTWATLPVRTELTAACVWPGREGAAAALSAMLRSSMSCALLTYVGVTATYQLALAGEAVTGEEVYITVHTQLLPPPASNSAATRDMGLEDPAASKDKKKDTSGKEENGKEESAAANAAASAAANAAKQALAAQEAAAADAARRPHALLQICVRSSLPDIAVAIATHPTEFLYDLTSGSAQMMGAHLAGAAVGGGAGGPRPPVHPRVAALEAAHAQSLRALPTATAALLGGSGSALPDVYAQGLNAKSKVSHRFMEAAAAAEWQRLAAQPV